MPAFDPTIAFTEAVMKPKAEWTDKTKAIKALLSTLPIQPPVAPPSTSSANSATWWTNPSMLLSLQDGYNLILSDLRSSLVSAATASLITLSAHSGNCLRPLIAALFEKLMNLLSQTIKVMQLYSVAVLCQMHRHSSYCYDKKPFSTLLSCARDKPQKHARLHAVTVIADIIKVHGISWNADAEADISATLAAALADQSQAVRMEARRACVVLSEKEGAAKVSALLNGVGDRRVKEGVERLLLNNASGAAGASSNANSAVTTTASVVTAANKLKKTRKPAVSLSSSVPPTKPPAARSNPMATSLPRTSKPLAVDTANESIASGSSTPVSSHGGSGRGSLSASEVFGGLALSPVAGGSNKEAGGALSPSVGFHNSIQPVLVSTSIVQIQSVMRGVSLRKSLGGTKLHQLVTDGTVMKEMKTRRMSVTNGLSVPVFDRDSVITNNNDNNNNATQSKSKPTAATAASAAAASPAASKHLVMILLQRTEHIICHHDHRTLKGGSIQGQSTPH